MLGGEAEGWAGSGGADGGGRAGGGPETVLSVLPSATLESACRSGHASSRIRARLPPLGTCPAALAFAAAPMPTDWPECGWRGPGMVPTDAASWVCPARGRMLTPRALGCLAPSVPPPSEGAWEAGGQAALPGGLRELRSTPPRFFLFSPLPSLSRLPHSGGLCRRVLMGKAVHESVPGFWGQGECLPHPSREEVSVRTRTWGGIWDPGAPWPGGVAISGSGVRLDVLVASVGLAQGVTSCFREPPAHRAH